MDDEPEELAVHADPDLSPAQARLSALTREFKNALAAQGLLSGEAHAKVSDFKAAVLERMYEELKQSTEVPPELRGWWRNGKRLAWMLGYTKAFDRVWHAMMRQESWSRVLRNPRKVQKRD